MRGPWLPYRAHLAQLRRYGLVVLMGLALLWMVDSTYDPDHTRRLRSQETELARLEELNRSLVEENSRLISVLDAMKNDSGYVVHLARAQLGMIRPGEIVYEFGPTARR